MDKCLDTQNALLVCVSKLNLIFFRSRLSLFSTYASFFFSYNLNPRLYFLLPPSSQFYLILSQGFWFVLSFSQAPVFYSPFTSTLPLIKYYFISSCLSLCRSLIFFLYFFFLISYKMPISRLFFLSLIPFSSTES